MEEEGIISGILTIDDHDVGVYIEDLNSGSELEDYRGSLESLEDHLKDWRFEDEKLKLVLYHEEQGENFKVITLHIYISE